MSYTIPLPISITLQGTKILKLDDLVKMKLAKISYRCVYDKISDTNSKCFTTSSSCIWPLLDDNVKRAKTVRHLEINEENIDQQVLTKE